MTPRKASLNINNLFRSLAKQIVLSTALKNHKCRVKLYFSPFRLKKLGIKERTRNKSELTPKNYSITLLPLKLSRNQLF